MPDDTPKDTTEETEKLNNLERSANPPDNHPEVTQATGDKDEEAPAIGSNPVPEPTPDNEFDEEEITDFFSKKGAVELLAQLAEGPKRFSHLNDALVISHGTVSTRLTEGAKMGLWREFITYPDDGGKIKLYELTPEAHSFAEIAQEENIRKTTEQKRQASQNHADALANFQNKIREDESSE